MPHIEGLAVKDFLEYARTKAGLLHYLPDERDWLHIDKQWLCDVLYTLDYEDVEYFIADRKKACQKKRELVTNEVVSIRPEFS